MAESLFASLLHTLDKSNISQIASSLGESEQCVSRGLESSLACALGLLADKAENPGALRQMLDLVPDNSGEVSWAKLTSGLSSSRWQWALRARQIVSGLFGPNELPITNAIARECGISSGSASTLIAMAAPMVLRFVTRRIYDEGWSMRIVGMHLAQEVPTLRSALPVGLSELLLPRPAVPVVSPVIAQSIQHDRTGASWIATVALGAMALGCFWLWTHARRPASNLAISALGSANRMSDEGQSADRAESRLLGAIQQGNTSRAAPWVDLDRLTFDPGSAALGSDSSEQLDHVAAILRRYPSVQLTIAGHTDDAGSADRTIQISRERAETVKNELVARGIDPNRLYTQGNAPPRGRRVSLQIIER
jgi:outer membrane protein OmpA-like peptidoglycan-associated protein